MNSGIQTESDIFVNNRRLYEISKELHEKVKSLLRFALSFSQVLIFNKIIGKES